MLDGRTERSKQRGQTSLPLVAIVDSHLDSSERQLF
jgi:hypothetical protein